MNNLYELFSLNREEFSRSFRDCGCKARLIVEEFYDTKGLKTIDNLEDSPYFILLWQHKPHATTLYDEELQVVFILNVVVDVTVTVYLLVGVDHLLV